MFGFGLDDRRRAIRIEVKLDAMIRHTGIEDAVLRAIQEKDATIMSTIDDLVTQVAAEKDEIASTKTFIAGLEQKVSDALSGITLPPAQQAKVDQLFSDLKQNNDDLAAAITTTDSSSSPPATPAA